MAARRRSSAGTAAVPHDCHSSNIKSGLQMPVNRPRKVVGIYHKLTYCDIVLFALMLLAAAMIPFRCYLYRWMWAQTQQKDTAQSSDLHHNLFGHYAVYSAVLRYGHAVAPCTQSTAAEERKLTALYRKTWGLLLLLLMSGDVHLNPGPVARDMTLTPQQVTVSGSQSAEVYDPSQLNIVLPGIVPVPHAPQNSATLLNVNPTIPAEETGQHNRGMCQNPAVAKHKSLHIFQTVNHARVIWDRKLKPKGLFGGHLNIRSLVSKADQLKHLLTNSNLDFLCISETWLRPSTPEHVFTVPGYQCFRRDRPEGKGGGVLLYIKDAFKCERIFLKTWITWNMSL
ncbi:hypothetical protein WMY93_030562 [Mugilogobius chulae]|uniref:Uncharacterized protein n=1 Tax=Mugilogobius chulae TaxID=88201 RepID=A0AAW0MDD6_9GOBI